MPKQPESPDELLCTWDLRLLTAMDAHYASAHRYSQRNKQFGIPSVVLAAIVATLAFATIRVNSIWISLSIGVLGTVQFVLSALHTWLRYAEIAEEHRQAAAHYAALRRRIEQIRAFCNAGTSISTIEVTELRNAIESLGREAPTVPPDLWRKSAEAFGAHQPAQMRPTPIPTGTPELAK